MLQAITFLAIVVALLVVLNNMPHNREARRQRNDASEADTLLQQAESRLLVADYGEARRMYIRALYLSEGCGEHLLASEALYGLARVALAHGDTTSAETHLKKAVELSAHWQAHKPELAALLARKLEEVRACR